MNFDELRKVLVLTANRSIKRQYRYFLLKRSRLSEPEVRHVMTKILEERRCYYAIEVATKEKHLITGKAIQRSALTDLVIYGDTRTNETPIWIELKRGQPKIDKIAKDFVKMISEPSLAGACFFHILPEGPLAEIGLNERARRAVIDKYRVAYNMVSKKGCQNKWFSLFILDSVSRQYYILFEEDLCSIEDFTKGEWKKL